MKLIVSPLRPRLLLSDFGECQMTSEMNVKGKRSGATGTLEFMAPELLLSLSFNQVRKCPKPY
jgi:serine/threonine protein kinase